MKEENVKRKPNKMQLLLFQKNHEIKYFITDVKHHYHHKGKNKQSATTKGAAIVAISNPTETKFGKWKIIHKSKSYYNPEMTTPVSDITRPR